ncbi:MAG: extracellular solute-binding protein [Eubacterium sp.]|nr:extracellular solute-binding protein [Eubacterium sp.]
MKLKRTLAAILAVSSVISLSACSSGTTSTTQNTSSQEESSESSIDDDIRNPVDVNDLELSGLVEAEDIEPAELTYLGNYNITTAGDVKPAYKYFEENYGCTIKCKIVSSSAISERLTTMISSGESPDLIDYAENVFPLMMSKAMLTPLEDYMDMSAPQWAGLESYINKYVWGGHNYYYPWSYNVSPIFLMYNRGLFEELHIDDPKELYDEGKWDWDALKRCLQQFKDSQEGREGIYGYTATAPFDSTGVPLIEINEDGMLQSNLVDPNIERAANFLQDLKREGLALYPEGGYQNVDEAPLVEGLSAFQAMGEWKFAGYAQRMQDDPSQNYFLVPWPKDPSADEYYIGMSTFGYMVPAGAEHVQQAAVFINCCRLSKTDEALVETTKDSIMKDKGYNEEQYEFILGFQQVQNFNPVIDEPYGMDDTTATIIRQMIDNVIFQGDDETLNSKSWTQMREENRNAIDAQVAYYNDLITNSNGVAS